MQQVHRTTLWRRRRNASRKKPSSRRLKGGKEDAYNLDLVAKLMRAYVMTLENPQTLGERISMGTARTVPKDEMLVVTRFVLLEGSSYPPGAIVAAVWDRLKPEVCRRTNANRGRGVSIKNNKLVQAFAARNPGLSNPQEVRAIEKAAIAALVRGGHSKAAATKLVEEAEPRGAGWVREFAQQGNAGAVFRPSDRTACASRWFKISPRMLAYYRRTYDCEQVAAELFEPIEETVLSMALKRLMARAARQLVRSQERG
jgi:hypothetical protein